VEVTYEYKMEKDLPGDFFVTDTGYLRTVSGQIGDWLISSDGSLSSTYKNEDYNYKVQLYGDHIQILRWVDGGSSAPLITKYWHEL
jgi:hypothetical protein